MHPDSRAAIRSAAVRLVLRDLVGMVDLAVVDPAGVDVERLAEQRRAHHAAFDVPAGCAAAPRRIPFHLAGFARRSSAPDREVGRVAFAVDALDPALALVGRGARQLPVIGHRGDIEIQPARKHVAVPGLDPPGPRDHPCNVVGRARMLWLSNVEPGEVVLEHLLVISRNVPRRLALRARCFLQLVVARVGVAGEVADIGDVDDVGELVALVAQRPAQRIGEDIRPHVADVLVVVDRRPARINRRLARPQRDEILEAAGQAVEKAQGRGAIHDPARLGGASLAGQPARSSSCAVQPASASIPAVAAKSPSGSAGRIRVMNTVREPAPEPAPVSV